MSEKSPVAREFDLQYLMSIVRKYNIGKNRNIFYEKYVPPTPLQLYKKIPQYKYLTYKSEATFYNALFVLMKKGWLMPRDDWME